MNDYPSFENAHPIAKSLMKEEFFWSPMEETAPFGSDDGADTYINFAEWRLENKSGNPKDFLVEQIQNWGYPTFDLTETDLAKLKPYLEQNSLGSRYMSGIDAAVVAIAFGQIYLEGTVDKDFKALAILAIQRQLHPELLNLWSGDYKQVRATQLKKMMAVLGQID